MTKREETNGFDLADLDGVVAAQEQGTDVKILHPATGEEIGVVFHVVGQDSEAFRRARRALVNARLRKGSRKKTTAEEIEADASRTLAKCVLSWSTNGEPGVKLEGEVLELTTDNVMRVLRRFPFMQEQLDEVVGSRAAFLED